MGVIAALLPHPERLQRLRAAVRDRDAVIPCDDWVALTRACEREPAYAVVLDLYAGGAAAPGLDRVRVLQTRFPRLAIVAYVSVTAERARHLFDAGRCGIDGLVVADADDTPHLFLAELERAASRSAAGLVRRALRDDLRPIVRDAVLAAVARAHERLTPERLARLVAVPRRVLTRRLLDAGFPPPHRLITWGRLIVAAHLLEDDERSADGVADALDFPSGSAFRNSCQRYLRATPQEIRAAGGAAFVVSAFLADGGRVEDADEAEPEVVAG
jgi:AraC-like DNA-binding protein